jgi:hypothetical protein
MNHAQNTPGYPVRLQVLFTLKDGVQRSYMLTELGGHGCLVELPFEVARGYVEKHQADEIAVVIDEQAYGRRVPLVELAKDGGALGKHGGACCGSCAAGGPCQKSAAGTLEVDVVGVQKTTTAFAGRGRLVTGTSVGEPLLAVAEAGVDGKEEHRVACCGGACEMGPGTPNALIFDRYSPSSDGAGGGYKLEGSQEFHLPKKLTGAYAQRAPTCLPWVRITRSPEKFRGCLAAARALGPIFDSKVVVKLVGEYLMGQDQECFLVILLDSQLQVRGISEIARGARDRVDVPVSDTLRIAIVDGATAMVICHNHPSGTPKPSDSDKELTKTIKAAAKTVHLELMDHVIIADGKKHYSFAREGKL